MEHAAPGSRRVHGHTGGARRRHPRTRRRPRDRSLGTRVASDHRRGIACRSINWRATARTGRLMATELIPERAQPLVICLDHGRLMGIGAGELTKLDHAINATLLLVHVALRAGDRAGMLAFSDTVTDTLPPRAGTAQLRRFLDATRPIQPGETEADYDDALTFFSRWQTRRSLVVIFTDVLDPDQGR